jgi:hypothetical protein
MSFWGSVWPIPVGCLFVTAFFVWLDWRDGKRRQREIEEFIAGAKEDGLFTDRVCSRHTNKDK